MHVKYGTLAVATAAVPVVDASSDYTMEFNVTLHTRVARVRVSSSAIFESALSSILSLGFDFLLDHCYVRMLFFFRLCVCCSSDNRKPNCQVIERFATR